MSKIDAPSNSAKHSKRFAQNALFCIPKIGSFHRKLIAATGIVILVTCILGVGQRLRIKIQQQTDFLESELILSVHEFNQLQREVIRLHEQMVMPASITTSQSITFHQNLVQSRINVIKNRLEGNDRRKDLGHKLSEQIEQILKDWEMIQPGVFSLQKNVSNQNLKNKNAVALRDLELEINHFSLLNQNRNRNRYHNLLKAQRNSLHLLLVLLFVFLLLVSIFTIYMLRFIRVRHQMLEEMKRLSSTDELTQIPNRRQFNEVFSQEWHRMMREGSYLSIILCDIDYFKRYNDCYGHQAGDVCLQQVAQALQQGMCRAGDFVARYGGEEFVIILPDTSLEAALDITTRLQSQVNRLVLEHSQSSISSHVTLSLGIASGMPSPALNREAVLKCADQALYEAKERGRDRACARTFDLESLINPPC